MLAAAGAVFWFGLGMQRGVLLSEDIKSRVWPWAPTFPAGEIVAPALSDPVWQFVLHPRFAFSAETFRARLGLDLEEVYSGADGRILVNRRAKSRARLDGAGSVRIEERLPLSWRFAVTAEAATRLTVANPFFPGWTVRVGGKPQALSARPGEPFVVEVPAGTHRVELLYRPVSFGAGCAVALASALVLGLAVLRRPSAAAPL